MLSPSLGSVGSLPSVFFRIAFLRGPFLLLVATPVLVVFVALLVLAFFSRPFLCLCGHVASAVLRVLAGVLLPRGAGPCRLPPAATRILAGDDRLLLLSFPLLSRLRLRGRSVLFGLAVASNRLISWLSSFAILRSARRRHHARRRVVVRISVVVAVAILDNRFAPAAGRSIGFGLRCGIGLRTQWRRLSDVTRRLRRLRLRGNVGIDGRPCRRFRGLFVGGRLRLRLRKLLPGSHIAGKLEDARWPGLCRRLHRLRRGGRLPPRHVEVLAEAPDQSLMRLLLGSQRRLRIGLHLGLRRFDCLLCFFGRLLRLGGLRLCLLQETASLLQLSASLRELDEGGGLSSPRLVALCHHDLELRTCGF
mmetsp:Transcript_79112/g.229799  ORF Transcript_79112/g.229799 Transcript_79112/m.229799 type:complete len:363 (-) Transcript_79112:661-1749(-)